MPRGPLVAMMVVATAVTLFPTSSASSSPSDSPAAAAASGMIGIRLIAPPGTPSTNPLTSTYIVDHLAPGARLSRTVELLNNSNVFLNVSVYVAAATVVRGHFVYADGTTSNELSRWTSVSTKALRLAPHSTILDFIATKVPDDATRGSRFAVVWAAVSATPASGHGITLVSRVGVRMYLSIGPGGEPPSNFTLGPLTASRESSGQVLIADVVHNTGKTMLALGGRLKLSNGPNNLRAGPFVASVGAILLPGASEPVTIALASNFPRGPWRADLRVRSGSLQRTTLATITFPSRAATRKPVESRSFLGPLLIAGALTLSAFLVGAVLVRHRRRRPPRGTATT